METLLLLGIGGAALYFLTRDEKKPQATTPSVPLTPQDPGLSALPGFAALPAEIQNQMNWLVLNGSKAQLEEAAAWAAKYNMPQIAAYLRAVAAKKA